MLACRRSGSASGGSLIEVAAVGEHRRLIDAAEAAGRVDRAGEEREVLRQVREVHLRQLRLRVVARPLERAADDVEVRVGPVAHHAVAFEQALHQPFDDLRVLLGEASVHDQHVGDDQQVAVGREHVRLAAAAVDDLRDLRLPRDAAGEPVLARLQVGGEQIAGAEAVLGVDEVEALGMRRRVEAAERVDGEARFLREVADEEVHLGELRRRDRLALELVDALDVAADDDAVGAAREADLRRHDRVELPAVDREHVGGRHRRRRSCLRSARTSSRLR